jgi:hypothetical protein
VVTEWPYLVRNQVGSGGILQPAEEEVSVVGGGGIHHVYGQPAGGGSEPSGPEGVSECDQVVSDRNSPPSDPHIGIP